MISYGVKWRPQALDELRKLPKEIVRRLVKRVDIAKVMVVRIVGHRKNIYVRNL